MNIADNRFENSRMYKNDINNGPYMTYNSESDRNGVIAPRIVTETGDVIDLYPFTKEGQEQWQAQIVREMAHVLDDNTDLKKELQEPWQKAAAAHNNPILARYEKQYGIESSFMDTKPTYDKLLAMCPTYKRYLELCKDAGKYIDMEFPEFMPWGIGTSPRGEFYTRKQMNDNPIQEKMNIRNR